MDDIEALRRKLREAENRALEEQRRREEAENRALQDQHRRQVAEALTAASQPQNLQQYLETCHSLHLAIEVVTNRSLTTQGETTHPTGRIFPRRIIPWDDFAMRQEEIWNDLSISELFCEPAYPSNHQMEYVRSLLKPFSSEVGLRDFERDVVENAVQNARICPEAGASSQVPSQSEGNGQSGGSFCIYRTSECRNVPALAVEYKAPHKLSLDEIITGLEAEVQPERDVINKDSQGFVLTARRLAAAVVTQLFSYMIGKGIQFGYICTGQALVLLHIPNDPSTVYFSVCVPNQDVMDDDETSLRRTAVAQVFAFILQALRARPPPQMWHDAAETLGIWTVEYDDILRDIPPSERKRKEPRASPYRPQHWKGFKRSPIRTRSRCQQPGTSVEQPKEDDEDPPSPTPNPSRTSGKLLPSMSKSSSSKSGNQGRRSGRQQQRGVVKKSDIQDRPLCTQRCLLGLAHGRPLDKSCPSASYHGQRHISRLQFRRLVRHQLAVDRGYDADCAPLHRSGSRGSLFKVRLTSHGYTLVAKGVEGADLVCLQHEKDIYDQLQPIQGEYVPICLGIIVLAIPYYYDSGIWVHFMFLSWAGQPILDCVDPAMKAGIATAVAMAYRAVHKLRVLHRDAQPRNILYNTTSRGFMVVDFERAEFHCRRPLVSIKPNLNRKRKRRAVQKQKKNDFARELESAVANALSCVVNLPF
ncbi:lipopolysaccharide kinase (Kdo/WaaP) family protein [Metarhizium robertsii]|uniref:Serine/threonine protein kinase n=2 Tax=Metarhizium robertsii TaxID=568076 RepID=E9EM36_METRA|nr:serine/threonine protein kinase [Metarhizium robertsii ARSEF 23]EFZ04007.2 serine/threonine protein kinase [Metarhizium robertsii ARSEF 23]EXU94819.1 lipopolysaccharide kinase (Kdo/WaaP) family protein [Metarhizium robertsii]